MKKILVSLILCSISTVYAQPVIENANLLPTTSYSYAVKLNQGFSGTIDINSDVIWDFTALSSISPGPIAIIEPSTSLYGANFPTADFAYQIANMYSYFDVSSTEMIELSHTITSIGGTYDFSANGKKILQFPFNFGGTFTDDFINNSTTYSVDVTYAGFGTLNLPNSYSYSNVALITEMSPLTNIYRWYTMNPFMSVAIYREIDQAFVWIEQDPGLGNLEQQMAKLNVFPNPIEDVVTIQLANNESIDNIEIYSLDGKRVLSVMSNFVNNQMQLKTDNLESGTYLLKVGSELLQLVK